MTDTPFLRKESVHSKRNSDGRLGCRFREDEEEVQRGDNFIQRINVAIFGVAKCKK